MIGVKVENIDEYLGKPVNDPYGRRVGYLISFYSDSDGNITSLEVSIGDFEFKQFPIDRFKFENGNIVLLSEWEYNALVTENRLERLKKRIAALEELNSRKEVPKHAYEEYRKRLDETLIKIKEESKAVKEMLRKRLHEIEDIMVELEKCMTNLKVSYIGGEIPEKSYKLAADLVRKNMDVILLEKESVKKHLDRIEALENLPVDVIVKKEGSVAIQQDTQQPMQVVVLEG
ncbi:MAG: CdvA-like protein [Thermosphaera sp.]